MNQYEVIFEKSIQKVSASDTGTAIWAAEKKAGWGRGNLVGVELLDREHGPMDLVAPASKDVKKKLPSRRQKGITLIIDRDDSLESGYGLYVTSFQYGDSLLAAAGEGVLYDHRDEPKELTDEQQEIVDLWEQYQDDYIEQARAKGKK